MASTALRLGSLTELANLTLARQVEEVRMRAIIVTTHGSQAVSLAFVRACTVVIVLVPGLLQARDRTQTPPVLLCSSDFPTHGSHWCACSECSLAYCFRSVHTSCLTSSDSQHRRTCLPLRLSTTHTATWHRRAGGERRSAQVARTHEREAQQSRQMTITTQRTTANSPAQAAKNRVRGATVAARI